MATPPGASAPEFDRGLSSFFVWQALLFAPGPIKIQWRPVFVWLFLPLFFNPGGLSLVVGSDGCRLFTAARLFTGV